MKNTQIVMAGALAALLTTSEAAQAADHAEAPAASADAPADIADFYAWYSDASGSGRIVVALTYAGVGASQVNAVYDADVLYGVHVDLDQDSVPDTEMWVRFGQNGAGDWGMQVQGVPGASGDISGPVGEIIEDSSGLRFWAGKKDDPFFFDLQGFQDTLATGTLSFTGTDGLAGLNASAIVFEIDSAALVGDGHTISIWATTARK